MKRDLTGEERARHPLRTPWRNAQGIAIALKAEMMPQALGKFPRAHGGICGDLQHNGRL